MRLKWWKNSEISLQPAGSRPSDGSKSDQTNNHDESHEESTLYVSDHSASPRVEGVSYAISECNSEEEFSSIGQKLLVSSLSSTSLYSDEFDSEGETVSTRTFSASSSSGFNTPEKRDFNLVGFFKKLRTAEFQAFTTFKKLSTPKHSRDEAQTKTISPPCVEPSMFYCFESSWKNFNLADLKEATNDFSEGNLIAEGGYSSIYQGTLDYGQLVAVKKLKGSQEESISDYLSELGILVHVNHPNIANVIGYGIEDGMHLVLPLSPYGSLESMLKGHKEELSLSCRYKIALGVASGLAYLHEGCQRRIIHRDIKAANILLTEDFEAQICDFGLAKWLPEQWTHLTVNQFEGTFGYLPPEYFLHGIVDEKTDVYSYGVVLLEIITGRPAIDASNRSVVMWAKPLLMNKDVEKLVDPTLGNVYDLEELNRMIKVVSLCIQEEPSERPEMSKVVAMLQGEKLRKGTKKFQRTTPILKRSSP